jgi:hypothetical protein
MNIFVDAKKVLLAACIFSKVNPAEEYILINRNPTGHSMVCAIRY